MVVHLFSAFSFSNRISFSLACRDVWRTAITELPRYLKTCQLRDQHSLWRWRLHSRFDRPSFFPCREKRVKTRFEHKFRNFPSRATFFYWKRDVEQLTRPRFSCLKNHVEQCTTVKKYNCHCQIWCNCQKMSMQSNGWNIDKMKIVCLCAWFRFN